MRIALPIWSGRVCTTFDFACRLLLVDLNNGCVISRFSVIIDEEHPFQRACRLRDLEVKVLICGAISRCLAGELECRGIEIISNISGSADEVLDAYLNGSLSDPGFLLPGCVNCSRKSGRRRKRFYNSDSG